MSDAFGMAALDAPPELELVTAAHATPWHARRALGFGASDVAALFVAYDLRDPATLGDKARKNGRRYARGRFRGIPRIVAEKAGAVAPLATNDSVIDAGKDRERALVEQWKLRLEKGTAGPDADLIDPASVLYVPDSIPIELIPIVDRVEPCLVVSPDVLARDVLGGLGCWDTKCSVEPYADKDRGFPLEHVIQVNAQYAACSATHGGIVEGECWAATWLERGDGPNGNVITWAVERDESLITEIRQVVRRAWTDVLEVRAEMENA